MAEHILDAFIMRFVLDRSDFKDGVKEVEADSKRLREGQKKTFDEIEQAGRKTGESIKGITREVIGLGLAFMGAKSMASFVKDLAVGAASADRFGQTLGMSVQKVWAWRQAMKSVGGEVGEGDAALQRIQSIKMGLQTGNVDTGAIQALGRLGVSVSALQSRDAGGVLQKLAGSTGKVDPQLQANLLQQIGLPQSAVYFLQKGQSEVVAALKAGEANASKMEETAKATENLQAAITDLQTTIVGRIAGPLSTIADVLNRMFGNSQKSGGASASGGNWYDFLIPKDENDRPIWGAGSTKKGPLPGQDPVTSQWSDLLTGKGGGGGGSAHNKVMGFLQGKGVPHDTALGITAALHAESGLNPSARNGSSGAFGISQWLGPRKRRLMAKYGPHPTMDQQLEFLWGELSGGDPGGNAVLAQHSAGGAGSAMVHRFLRPAAGYETNRDIAHINRYIGRNNARNFTSMAKHAVTPRGGGGGNVNIGSITVNTQAKNAAEIARALPAELKRRGVVIRADRGIHP